MRLNVGYMYQKPIGTSREIPVVIDKLEIDDLVFKDFTSVIRLSRTREGLLLQIQAESDVKTACGRCLDEMFLTLNVEFEELYQFPSRHREETDLVLTDDGFIDSQSIYREYFILAMPIKRLCKIDCKGLCVECGTNMNEMTCEHLLESDSTSVIIIEDELK